MPCFDSTEKFRAFTLPELLVAMIVSGIVLGAVFSALHIVSARAMQFRESSKTSVDCSLMLAQLSIDFHRAETVCKTNSGFSIGENGNPLQYEFGETYVIRRMKEHVDTFAVRTAGTEIYRQGVPAVAGENGDRLILKIITATGAEPFSLQKPSAAKAAVDADYEKIINRTHGH